VLGLTTTIATSLRQFLQSHSFSSEDIYMISR
jgi:hypothetical protein